MCLLKFDIILLGRLDSAADTVTEEPNSVIAPGKDRVDGGENSKQCTKRKISVLGYPESCRFHAAMLHDTKGNLEAGGEICLFLLLQEAVKFIDYTTHSYTLRKTTHFSFVLEVGGMKRQTKRK